MKSYSDSLPNSNARNQYFYAIVYLTEYMGLQLAAWIRTYLPLHEDGVSADRYTIDIGRGLWRC